nr:zinc finger, CCHC-type [Tanacetum cinerariifolium]
MVVAMKHMALSFAKLEKFKGVDFRRWQKKMHFMLSSMSVVYVLTTSMPQGEGENPTVEQVRKRAKWDNDDYVCRGLIINGMSDSLFDIYQNVETFKELWDTLEAKYMSKDASSKKFLVSNFTNYKMTNSRPVLEQYNELLRILGSHLRIKESLRVQDSDKPKGNNVVGPLVFNMMEYNNSFMYNDNKGKRKHHDTRANPNKKPKVTCWKCGKPEHLKKDCKVGNVGNKANGSSTKGSKDGSSNSLKGQSMFNKSHQIYYVTYVSEAFFVQDDDVAWWVDSGATMHVCKDRCWFKIYESLNDGSILLIGNESTTLVHGCGCVDLRFSSRKVVSLLNVLHVPNVRKNLVSSSVLNNCGYKQVIESNKFIISKHGVFVGFGYLRNHMFRLNIVSDNICLAFMSTSKLNDSILWHARLGHVHFKRMQDMSKDGLILSINMDTEKCKTFMLNKITKKPFQNVKRKTKVFELIHSDLCDLHATPSLGRKKYFVTFIDDASREAVRLPDPKLKTLGKRGIECIFVGYAEHSKAFRFYVIEPNDSVAINSIIESRDAIFDEHRFSSVPRPSQRSLLRKRKRHKTPKDFRPEFQLYLIERTTDEVPDQHSYCFNFKDDPKTFNEVMKSQDVAFWKEAITNEMDSIMGNNTWVLTDLPPSCKPLGCEWIFKRKLKMDVKTAFLNRELKEEVYMNQPLGFIMPDNENKVCKLIKSLYGLKQAPKQWHQKFDEIVLSNGHLLNQANKSVYSKFDASGKGVIICLYVDDMLIFGTDQVQVDLIKEVLSLRFFIKDMEEADVIHGIRIKHESNGITISQSHYIEKVLKKFNYSDYTLVSTPLDTYEKLMPNKDLILHLLWENQVGILVILELSTSKQFRGNTEDNSSTSGWIFLLGGGAISWDSKKQSCNTGLTMEYEFVTLAAAGKEVEWLKNLLLEIPM